MPSYFSKNSSAAYIDLQFFIDKVGKIDGFIFDYKKLQKFVKLTP